MTVLLDACALLALARGELPDRAVAALRSAPEANVSAVTPWEIAIKAAGGKLRLELPAAQWFDALAERHQLRELPLEARVACAAAGLPPIHRDPFDRVLVALAHAHTLMILTSDENIPKHPGVTTIW